MSTKTRRSSSRKAEKEIKKMAKEDDEIVLDEDDDLPPPVLERETNCEDTEDSDGYGKEGENESSTSPPLKNDEFEDEEPTNKPDLLAALSHVFSAAKDGEQPFADPFPKTVGRPRRNPEPQFEFVPLKRDPASVANGRFRPIPVCKQPLRPASLLSSSSVSSTTPSTSRFAPLRQLSAVPASTSAVAAASASSAAGRRSYGHPPPFPPSLRPGMAPATGVGSNTAVGPARLLENRKRGLTEKEMLSTTAKRSSLVAYNGGRAGENFRKLPAAGSSGASSSSGTSTASSNAAIDAVSMLREQSPVQIQVTAGSGDNRESEANEAFEMANLQKDTIGNVTRAASNHNILLGSLLINGLNTLQSRNPDDYQNMSSEIYALLSKYKIH